jgi:hypothetical protein
VCDAARRCAAWEHAHVPLTGRRPPAALHRAALPAQRCAAGPHHQPPAPGPVGASSSGRGDGPDVPRP